MCFVQFLMLLMSKVKKYHGDIPFADEMTCALCNWTHVSAVVDNSVLSKKAAAHEIGGPLRPADFSAGPVKPRLAARLQMLENARQDDIPPDPPMEQGEVARPGRHEPAASTCRKR